ncbi:MAG: rod shape-determining protein MreC [Bryobacterales bacterium]|nr:rod shape-determining protein MreC [Bryobacterales bacterium]
MEMLLNRYRNITVLVMVLVAQLFLLAYQVKSNRDVRLIRVWAVTGVMPLAKIVDAVRANTIGLLDYYADLLKAHSENKKLAFEIGKLKLENQFLKTELATADRARALSLFQTRNPSRMIAGRIIGTGTGGGAKVVFVDRGLNDGVQKGDAVITPEGIVGKITAAYPRAAQVILITDPSFAAGVMSQKHRVLGTLKGQGHSTCQVEYIQNEEQVEVGEWFFTSGDDRVFPKGLPVGQAKIVRSGKLFFKEVFLVPSGLQRGLEDVLIVLEGVHQDIPDQTITQQPLHLLPPPPPEPKTSIEADRVIRGVMSTDADHLLEKYKRIGAAQGHAYGTGGVPNFNITPEAAPKTAKPAEPKPDESGEAPAPQPPPAEAPKP